MSLEATAVEVIKIPLESLVPNPHQPRARFEEVEIDRLAESIQDQGLISPIVVSKNKDGFSIVAGERRFRACKKLGLTDIEAIVTQGDPEAIALIENLLRVDLHPLEEAQAYARMIERKNYTHQDISRIVKKDRTTITKLLKLNDLDQVIKDECTTTHSDVSKSMLVEIAQVPREEQPALWRKAKTGANIRDIRRLVRAVNSKPRLPRVLRAGRAFLKQLDALPEAELPIGSSDADKLLQLLDEIEIKAIRLRARRS